MTVSNGPLHSYVTAIQPTASAATALHREWTRTLESLVTALGRVGLDEVLVRTADNSKFFRLGFATHLEDMSAVEPPTAATKYHELWLQWYREMISACQLLDQAAVNHDRTKIAKCRAKLLQARAILHALSQQADILEVELERESSG